MAIYKKVFISLSFLLIGIGSIAALKPEQDSKIVCKSIVDKDTKVLTDLFKAIDEECKVPGNCLSKIENVEYKCSTYEQDGIIYTSAVITRKLSFKWEIDTDIIVPFPLVKTQTLCEKDVWTYTIIENKNNPSGYSLLQSPESKIIELSLCK